MHKKETVKKPSTVNAGKYLLTDQSCTDSLD